MTRVEEVARAASERREARIDPGLKRRRGVVHTPIEVARFAVAEADARLATMGWGGIGDPAVTVIDPACGPGQFVAAAVAVARAGGNGRPRVIAWDVDRGAIRAARRTVGAAAEASGWRVVWRCGNTLASEPPSIAGVVAVIGNPPWASRSANADAAATARLMDDFRRDADGAPLRERKIGVLSDDYVRFWRWACEAVRRARDGGVVAFVTNGSFLDGPVHRGMRAAMARWFDAIDVVDLGGSALLASAGLRDENVFGVRPSVAVTIASRGAAPSTAEARVRCAVVRGDRDSKLAALGPGFEALGPVRADLARPLVRFTAPRRVSSAWMTWPSLAEAMPFHREGIQTNRDAVAIDADRDRLLERMHAFARGERREDLAVASRALAHYRPDAARRAVAGALERGDAIRRIAYRVLDDRWVCAVAPLCHRPRPELLAAVDRSRFLLATVRKDRGGAEWAHFGAARAVLDACWLSTRSSCRTRAFPTHTPGGVPNLAPEVAAQWSEALGLEVEVEGFALYVLAVLSSSGYRREHAAVLPLDYPRIPPPASAERYRAAMGVGRLLLEALARSPADGAGDGTRIGHWVVRDRAVSEALAASDRMWV